MGNWTDFSGKSLIDKIIHHLTGSTYDNVSTIKVNSDNLAVNGELYFINSFNAWKSFVVCDRNCVTILQHFTHAHESGKSNTDADVSEKVFEQLVSKSSDWPIRIKRCSLQKEKVCLYLNRTDVIPNVIKLAIKCNNTFGRIIVDNNKVFQLKYQTDAQSELTTQRLHLMRNITAKILNLRGYGVSDEDCVHKYMFTTKSEGSTEDGYKKHVCGVVKNLHSNTKEVNLTWEQCMKDRMSYVDNHHRSMFHEQDEDNTEKYLTLRNMAHAIITFDLMSVKPSRSIVIDCDILKSDKHITNTRGALFILYNTARITKIIAEYYLKVSHGDFSPLPNIDEVDFSQLQQEEEWELIYDFIFGYPQMLQNCLRCEPNFQVQPQLICLFLSRLCQKFSSYYRRTKILTRGGSTHLAPKMFARLYMLSALRVVLENTLDIFDIKPMSQM